MTYAYLLLSLWLLAIWIVCFALRPDLRLRMWQASIPGAIAGALAEMWYFADYWRPPTMLGIGVIAPEDFLVGFAVTGVAVALYDVVCGTKNVPSLPPRKKGLIAMLVAGLAALLIFSNVLGYNSCLVSEAMFLLLALWIVMVRRDLWKVALGSGLLTAIAALPAYIVLFGWLFPNYWDTYWLLENPFWRSLVWYHIPLTEILWYASWGFLAGVLQNYTHGTKKVRLPSRAPVRAQ